MPKVYAKVPGLELRVDRYGVATDKQPVEVPDEVAAELRKHPQLRVELHVEDKGLMKGTRRARAAVSATARKLGVADEAAEKKEE